MEKNSDIEVEIKIQNYKKSSSQSAEDYQLDIIRYYRTIFSRLLFIKILEAWKMLSVDPMQEIFEQDKRLWPFELKFLFFDVFNKKKEERPKDLPKLFKKLPYLNGRNNPPLR